VSFVSEVLQVSRDESLYVGQRPVLRCNGQSVPLVALSEVFGMPAQRNDDVLNVVLVENAGMLALQVHSIIGQRGGVRKELNRFIEGASLLTGTATVDGNQLLMFLNIPELFKVAGHSAWAPQPIAESDEPTKHRIVVVDDSELTRDMLISLLERLGYTVDEAVDGADALQSITRNMPDLVLTDLDMPVMDGFTLIERLRANPQTSDLPVLVLSTRGSDEDKRRAMKAGANAYLVKSAFRTQEIHRTLQQYLGRDRAR
jgi:two-component system, chemotaxis family, sensor kinase CheA